MLPCQSYVIVSRHATPSSNLFAEVNGVKARIQTKFVEEVKNMKCSINAVERIHVLGKELSLCSATLLWLTDLFFFGGGHQEANNFSHMNNKYFRNMRT